jgi:hypothetical protein
MPTSFKTFSHQAIGREFHVYKATKHFSVCNSDQSATSCAQPGDYVALDSFFNVLVFNRQQFKAAFGHKALQLLDEVEEST